MKTTRFCSTILLAVILLAITGTRQELNAQTSVTIGPKVGGTFNGFRGDDAGRLTFRKGVAGGLFLNVSPVNYFSIQPEFLFQQRGAVNENRVFNFREDVKIGSFNVPVLFKLRLPIQETFFPHIYAGPQFSYVFKSEYSVNAFDIGTFIREVELRNYDLGGVFGFGLDIELNHLFLTTDFRYGLGALSIGEEDVNLKNKDLGILFGVGYKF